MRNQLEVKASINVMIALVACVVMACGAEEQPATEQSAAEVATATVTSNAVQPTSQDSQTDAATVEVIVDAPAPKAEREDVLPPVIEEAADTAEESPAAEAPVVVIDAEIPEEVDTDDRDEDGYTLQNGDCNDNNSNTYPGAIEIYDGLDNDCDGEGDTVLPWDEDVDYDGFSIFQGDCNDRSTMIHPGAVEYLDGRDNDCDAIIDEQY